MNKPTIHAHIHTYEGLVFAHGVEVKYANWAQTNGEAMGRFISGLILLVKARQNRGLTDGLPMREAKLDGSWGVIEVRSTPFCNVVFLESY